MTTSKNTNKTKLKLTSATKILNLAKEALKTSDLKEKFSKIQNQITQLKDSNFRKELKNKKILDSLKTIGVATQADIQTLRSQIEKLETEVSQLKNSAKVKKTTVTEESVTL